MATSVTSSVPAWLDGVAVTGAAMRRQVYGGLFPNAGIVEGLAASSIPTPDMKVRLPAGLSMVDDGTGGFYPLDNAASVDLDIAASSASFGRYDSVIAEVVDTGVAATALYRYRVITGTAASSPVPPTLPAADQPTAKTLRIANVFVQVNAETNGKVRPQDVVVVAPLLTIVSRPVQSLQVGTLSNPSPTVGAWTDLTSGQWPTVTFTVPPSGMVYATVGAECINQSTNNTTRVNYRLSGAYTLAADFGRDAGGDGTTVAGRRSLLTGLPPGGVVTATPVYRMSSNAATRSVGRGSLLIEPV